MLSAAAAGLMFGGQASAQTDNSIDALTDVITVTATKRADAENVQDVPIAITAFDEDTLDILKVRDLQDLSFSTPNVSLDDIGTSPGTANFAIRGLGVNSSIPSIDPAVGVFVDGVYLGLNSGVVFDLFDLESIEVLRGPQGLLFGRNTTGGAVLVNTGNPTDEFEAKARVAYEIPAAEDRGGANRFVMGTVSGPLVPGKLNGKIGAYYNGDEGHFENLLNGEDLGERETYILRGALEFMPTDDFTVLGKVDLTSFSGDGPIGQNRGWFERDTFNVAIDEPGTNETEVITASLRTDWEIGFGDGVITNIFGYREISGETNADIDATPVFLFHSATELEQDQISNELRYTGTFGRAEVTSGLYYFNQDVFYTETRDLPPLSPLTFYGGGFQDHTVLGAFASMDYDLSDALTLALGLRYTHEEKDGGVTYVRPRPECSVVDETCPTSGTNPFVPGEPNGFTDDDEWSNFIPKVGLRFEPNDQTLVYADWTKGYRSGGYNFRITNPALFLQQIQQGADFSFDEEEVTSYEIGTKFQTPDNRGQLNLAAFYTDIENMQREVNISSPTAGVSQFIFNTADANILGFEAEGQYALTESLLLQANVGVIDAEYDSVLFDISSDGVVDDEDTALAIPRVPELTWGVTGVHNADLGNAGSLLTRVSYQYRDRFAYTDNNFGWVQEADILDANITWQTPRDGVSLSLYGRNLLDQVQVGNDTQVPFGFIPGFGFGEQRSNGVNEPFGDQPAAGTFSPLAPGRVVGIELTIQTN
jgi:iron complex outermembrane receptor protein